jgi:two-component system, chemotaxis family, CheB/CheR fusion protein
MVAARMATTSRVCIAFPERDDRCSDQRDCCPFPFPDNIDDAAGGRHLVAFGTPLSRGGIGMSDASEGTERQFDQPLPVLVGIGASAGGIRALQALFGRLPAKTGAAYVVVTHLDPQRRSELPQILAGQTQMPVIQVEATEDLKPNHVYVIPPDRRLQIVDRRLSAVRFNEPHGHRAAIDLFFRSMAERVGDGLSVILSGAGSDGALGVKAVKEAGGIILVQDPAEAEYSSMPRSAIATGVADFILPVQDLAAKLVELIALKRSGAISPEPALDEDALRRILSHLRIRTGHDFSKYKRSTVVRRIARRMQVTRTQDLQEYYEVLRDRAEEAQALLGDLLISVTAFFRDAEVFSTLQSQVLPRLFEARDVSQPIRVWVAGCATGEEAYTVAMLLLEEAARHDARPPMQVFGSDLDAGALATAREGWYSAAIEADVNEDRLRRYFTREGDGYRVRPELRDVVLFAAHDLLKDPPFSRINVLSCRNLLIYLDRELQEQVCGTFHYALRPGGFLIVGAAETADNPPGLFRAIDRNARIYQSMANIGEPPRLPPRLLGPVPIREPAIPFARAVSPGSVLSEAVRHRIAIEQSAPPSMLADEAHRVVHLSNSAGRFIAPSGGPLSGDVVDLVRPELRFELRSALTRAFEQREPSLSLPIPVRFNGKPTRVQLLVKPVSPEDPNESPQAIVMFIEGHAIDEIREGPGAQQQVNDTVRRLTEELELSQSRMRTMREESESANEELRAANEELQSINEEYRSTSEELETSKEELQSINEELQTVNSELKIKLDATSRAHSDLQNLMAATDIGTLFLDSALRIKRFTERITELFSITPADEGRPITDFAHRLEYEDLIRDTRAVLADLVPVRREVRSRTDRWYDMRIRPIERSMTRSAVSSSLLSI